MSEDCVDREEFKAFKEDHNRTCDNSGKALRQHIQDVVDPVSKSVSCAHDKIRGFDEKLDKKITELNDGVSGKVKEVRGLLKWVIAVVAVFVLGLILNYALLMGSKEKQIATTESYREIQTIINTALAKEFVLVEEKIDRIEVLIQLNIDELRKHKH